MALSSGFFNSIEGDRRYNAEEMSAIFDGVITDGVFDNVGELFATVPGTGRQVIVKPGKAWFNSTWTTNDSMLPLDIAPPDVTLKRYDAVVIEVNKTEEVRQNEIKIVTGVPATFPAKPSLVDGDDVHQHPIAYILIEPGISSIAASKIENVVGQAECPFVTSILESVPIDSLFSQWSGEFNEWFDTLQAQLSGNIATNLQNQINERVKKSDKATTDEAKEGVNDDHYVTPKTLHIGAESSVMKIGDLKASKRTSLGSNYALCNGAELEGADEDYPDALLYLTAVPPYIVANVYSHGALGGSAGANKIPYGTVKIANVYYSILTTSDMVGKTCSVTFSKVNMKQNANTTVTETLSSDFTFQKTPFLATTDGNTMYILADVKHLSDDTYHTVVFYKNFTENTAWNHIIVDTVSNAASYKDAYLFKYIKDRLVYANSSSDIIFYSKNIVNGFTKLALGTDLGVPPSDITYGTGYWAIAFKNGRVAVSSDFNDWSLLDTSLFDSRLTQYENKYTNIMFENGVFILFLIGEVSTAYYPRIFCTTSLFSNWNYRSVIAIQSTYMSINQPVPWLRPYYDPKDNVFFLPSKAATTMFAIGYCAANPDGSPGSISSLPRLTTPTINMITGVVWDDDGLFVAATNPSASAYYLFYRKVYYKMPSLTLSGAYWYMKVSDDDGPAT